MRVAALVMVAAVAWACLTGLAAAKDITGYKSGSNVWTLGAAKASVDLKGFVLQEGLDLPKGCQSYFDEGRTLKFSGVDKEASVQLIFWQGKLGGIVLSLHRDQMTFKALYAYFGGRYSDNYVPMEDQTTFKIWRDPQSDFLAIVSDQYQTPELPQAWTNVFYLTKDALRGLGGDLPVLAGLDGWIVGKMKEYIK